ncbi:uncharacterized protein LOC135819955 isoform X4 [Sycon ciliatum]|uniref:uncharacterized protein LOC135819955 isoform X4 n=1 Tax=Sycon ciliatum TaxID=27933 RepID=UPI0031F6A4A2
MMNVKRIKGEVKQMIESPPPGLSIRSSENDLCYVDCTMQAPACSPYQGGRFELIYRWNHYHPFIPPEVRFRTKIYHPNIDSHGNISLSFLTSEWSTLYTILMTLLSIQSILDDPLLDMPLVPEIARIYSTDRAKYNTCAKAWTMEYATGGVEILPERELEVPIIRIILLGESDVGKTSLACSLSRRRMPERNRNTSTLGVDMSTLVIDSSNDNRDIAIRHMATTGGEQSEQALIRQLATWIFQGNKVQQESTVMGTICTPSPIACTSHTSSTSQLAAAEDTEQAECHRKDDSKSAVTRESSRARSLHQSALEEITDKVTSEHYVHHLSELIVKKSLKVMRLWDTAGQDSYRILHHMTFGARRTSYIIVYNAKRSVKEQADHSNVRKDGECRPCSTALPGQPSLTYIHDALETIHDNVPDGESARVFLAGCHIDERQSRVALDNDAFKAELDEERHEIIRSIACQPFRNLLKKEDIFFIDNTVSGRRHIPEDKQLVTLRQQLCMESERQDPIPTARLLETLAIMEVSSHPALETPWITRVEIEELMHRINARSREPVSVEANLSFQHSIGTALYYPDSSKLRDRVIVDVPNVMQLAAALLQPSLTRADLDGEVSLQDVHRLKRGFISNSVAICLWKKFCPHLYPAMMKGENRQFFYDLMTSLDVLCHVGEVCSEDDDDSDVDNDGVVAEHIAKEMFWMPAAAERYKLPAAAGAVSPEIILSSASGTHLPHSMFLRIGTRCLSHYNAECVRKANYSWLNTALAKTCMRLPLANHMWLILRYMKCGVSICVEANSLHYEFGSGEGVPILNQIHVWVKDVLAVAHKKIKLKELLRCECGAMNRDVLCTLHGRENCSASSPSANTVPAGASAATRAASDPTADTDVSMATRSTTAVTDGPTATGPTATGPTATGPTATGPTATGPTATGPTATGPTATGPTAVSAASGTAAVTAASGGGLSAKQCFHTVAALKLGDVPMCPIAYTEGRTAPQLVSQDALRFWKSWQQDPGHYGIVCLPNIASSASVSAAESSPSPPSTPAPDDLTEWKYRVVCSSGRQAQ